MSDAILVLAEVQPEVVVGLPSEGFFIDIGIPESFEEAQLSVPHWWEGVQASNA